MVGGRLSLLVWVGSSGSASTHTRHILFPFPLRDRLLPFLRHILEFSHTCSRRSHLLGHENLCNYGMHIKIFPLRSLAIVAEAEGIPDFTKCYFSSFYVTLVVIGCMAQLQRMPSSVNTSAMSPDYGDHGIDQGWKIYTHCFQVLLIRVSIRSSHLKHLRADN